jgi:formamidopyrimidine-DNA glycosylase
MPELPEVETIARRLRHGTEDAPALVGREVHRVDLLWERTLAFPGPSDFLARLPGPAIRDVGRRGKLLVFSLTQDTLLIHLRMSGDMLVRPADSPLLIHDRLVLYLDHQLQLAFNDARKFGRAWLLPDPAPLFARLGPEPLDPQFGPDDLYQRLQKTRRQLKPLLLDQAFLAGVGNIYSDEALHLARIHPLRISNSLSPAEAERLWRAIRQVLQEGIARQGASIDWVYRGGDFQNYFRVYRRTGLPCPTCGSPIERTVIGQRSTHICFVCQSEPEA